MIKKVLLHLSTHSRLVLAEKSVHAVQVEQLEIVTAAIEVIYRM